eukprot:CAMPEP_0201883302 /NCGR_PEP_ID=MMETSP0902-20130614/15354_1 /ASSEMBLY_ACC=CAM_ASM_000551 /TAXON_ID=420261 /ORGANISM="Thalassiosira antarctica, Strain CCMP982" /LENGTH=170 /DNA_ID=CAMNT_0048412057 /DNA_START=60 /DNA_END=572 /DNA_ORIENTATION=-
MKTFAITAAITTLFVASTHAANPSRKRTETRHKSLDKARVFSDEIYDPYLGMARQRKRGLEGHESMSMVHTISIPMSMSTEYPPKNTDADISADTSADQPRDVDMDMSMSTEYPPENTDADISADTSADTPADQPRDADTPDVVTVDESGAMAIGTTLSALAAVGAVLLL